MLGERERNTRHETGERVLQPLREPLVQQPEPCTARRGCRTRGRTDTAADSRLARNPRDAVAVETVLEHSQEAEKGARELPVSRRDEQGTEAAEMDDAGAAARGTIERKLGLAPGERRGGSAGRRVRTRR